MARARKHFPPIRWRSASDESRSGQKLQLVFQGKKTEKRLIYGTGFSARHDSPTSICFFFCGVSFTAPALPGQSPPSVTFFPFFSFQRLAAQSTAGESRNNCAKSRCKSELGLRFFPLPSNFFFFQAHFTHFSFSLLLFFFNHYLEYRCASHPP